MGGMGGMGMGGFGMPGGMGGFPRGAPQQPTVAEPIEYNFNVTVRNNDNFVCSSGGQFEEHFDYCTFDWEAAQFS
jgi:hypothetical protein